MIRRTGPQLQTDETAFREFLERITALGGERLVRSPHTRPILRMIFDAQRFTLERVEPTLLNILASRDNSGFRERVYRPLFDHTKYQDIDLWEDKYIYEGRVLPNSYTLPFADNSFDAVLTTKVLLEHISEPGETIREFARVLKPGGEAFIIAPFIVLLHQQPNDFFRFTEFGIRHLFKKAGLEVLYIKPTLSGFMTTMDSFMLFNVFGLLPVAIRRRLNSLSKRYVLPIAGFLDRYIPDQGRFTRHYICRVRKRPAEPTSEIETEERLLETVG